MRHLACITCGKEKLTKGERDKPRCKNCGPKGNTNMRGKKLSSETKNKMSLSHVGKPTALEHRKNLSIAMGGTGELNRIYPGLGAWSSRNKLKTPFCEWCYSEDNLEAHHILPKARFPQYATDDSNCRVMCAPCHITCHKQGGF